MNRNLARNLSLIVFGALLGAGFLAELNAKQSYRPETGYSFWKAADDNLKTAYLMGYADAEQLFRVVLDKGAKPLCTDEGKAWIADFDRKILEVPAATISQLKEGLDEFYRDWRNQSVGLKLAQNIVKLQLAGRPADEVSEAIRKAREPASSK
jgi:hypothetical protein